MKYMLFSILSLIGLCSTAQTTRRVNGDPNITGVNVYNTIQAAVDAANTDDVILIEFFGNGNNYYTGANVTKRLHFRGQGYNLSNPNLSPKPSTSSIDIGTLNLKNGSSGSSLKSILSANGLGIFASNINITSSKLGGISLQTEYDESGTNIISEATGLVIKKSIVGTIGETRNQQMSTATTDMIVENSYLYGGLSGNQNSVFTNCNFTNCIFLAGGFSPIVINPYSTNCQFLNCIFSGTLNTNNANTVAHSIALNSYTLPSGNGNQSGVDPVDVFLGGSNFYSPPFHANTGFEILAEINIQLSPTSVAKNAGLNGVDIGIYGGPAPYEFSGLPSSPINEYFFNSGTGNNTTNISATATFKAN